MGLKQYNSKRNPERSREPLGLLQKKKIGALEFCVQKHAARTLHYDFRLEYKGVLLSWAIPKGPSQNPKDKRLAIKVEDHPYAYRKFEGTIPKGNYGAGTVEIWDRGTYTIPGADTAKEAEKIIGKGLQIGHLHIVLHGDKLSGEFTLLKLKKDPEDSAWLLIKKKDKFADSKKKSDELSLKKMIKNAKQPEFISPMLAQLIDKPFTDNDWLFEIKWDGYRALAFIKQNSVELKSRNELSFTKTYSEITKNLKKIKRDVILDGELVVVDEKGKAQFGRMQNYAGNRSGNLCYYVFDILFLDGMDLRQLPLIERKEILKKLIEDLSEPNIRYNDHIIGKGISFFKTAIKNQLEGIIGKQINSQYISKRSSEWVKIKTFLSQEVVIAGFTEPRGTRKKFGALIVGIYDNNKKFHYCGHVGGGFDESLLHDVYKKLQAIIQKKCPFEKVPKTNAEVTWVKPSLICEVSFAEWTKDKIMRQPIFKGLREKMNPKSVIKEIKKNVSTVVKSEKKSSAKKEFGLITHPDKLYWPEEGITKYDLVKYYEEVAGVLIPHLKNRPIMLHRFPAGTEKPGFYQKDINFSLPPGIKTVPVVHEDKTDEYLLIDNETSLLFAINLGCIDLHPFLSRTSRLLYPDFCVIDFDPRGIGFDKVIEAALVAFTILDELEIEFFCKTSGGKGLHIYIPLHGKYEYEQSNQFAHLICLCIQERLPKITSLERSPKKREEKIYLDYMQNRTGQTVVAPYSVRPRPGALVSTPLDRDEVNKKLKPEKFTIRTIPDRIKEKGDIFSPVLTESVNIKKILKSFPESLKP